jgi:hypothetical protein
MTATHLTLFTKGMFLPFSCSTSSETARHLEKSSSDFFPSLSSCFRAQTDLTAVSPRCSLLRTRRSCLSVSHMQASSENRTRFVSDAVGALFIHRPTMLGQGRKLDVTCHYFSWRRKLSFYRDFLSVRKEAISLKDSKKILNMMFV